MDSSRKNLNFGLFELMTLYDQKKYNNKVSGKIKCYIFSFLHV